MKNIRVEPGDSSYEIRVGAGIMAQAGPWLKKEGFSGKAAVITDTNVGGLYAGKLERSLSGAGFTVNVLEIAAGEEQKTLETAGMLYDRLSESFAERSTPILALGGGVIGDLAGFVAATYMRGVPLVQVPTSLLAMVDSSIGGKTAVDRGKLKNIVGAFYQPKMVIADTDTLKTLPKEEFSNGMAEVIKHAIIRDAKLFRFLAGNMEKVMALDAAALENVLEKNMKIKAGVVEADEKETGVRAILNFGHTVGHAVEAVSNYKLKHGQAVAIGMAAAAKISARMGMLRGEEVDRIEKVIEAAGLPVKMPGFSDDEKGRILEAIKHDKKVQNGKVRFILLKDIGVPVIRDDIEPGIIGEVLFG